MSPIHPDYAFKEALRVTPSNVMDASYDEAYQANLSVRKARYLPKFLFAVLGAAGAFAELWAIMHGRAWGAAALVVVAVFGVSALTEGSVERRSPLGFMNLRRRSWGFIAMGSLLAWVAYTEASVWSMLVAPAWLHDIKLSWWHLRYDWPRTGVWVLIALGVVLIYSLIFRRGEAKNYRDNLVFNSYGKIAHDFVAVPVSFVAVVSAAPLLLCTNWSALFAVPPLGIPRTPTGLVIILLLVWWLLGMVDLLRLKSGRSMHREDLHIQAGPNGRRRLVSLYPTLSPAQFRERRKRTKQLSVFPPDPVRDAEPDPH